MFIFRKGKYLFNILYFLLYQQIVEKVDNCNSKSPWHNHIDVSINETHTKAE